MENERKSPEAEQLLLHAVASAKRELNADLIVYNGPITYEGFRQLQAIASSRTRMPNVRLFLTTLGGDPHAAFRIARSLRSGYSEFGIVISSLCKSAGTLVALGANELIFSDTGELGPLDIQLRKPNEMFEFESGLDITQALVHLTEASMDMFSKTLVEITAGAGMSTKTAAEIANGFVSGLYGNIFSQIDPIRIGEVARANRVSMHYGKAIGDNLKDKSLEKLVYNYPSHACVIDQDEASRLFERVRRINAVERELLTLIGVLLETPKNSVTVLKLNQATSTSNEDVDNEDYITEKSARGTRTAGDSSEGEEVAGAFGAVSDTGEQTTTDTGTNPTGSNAGIDLITTPGIESKHSTN